MKKISEIWAQIEEARLKKIVVACAADEPVLEACVRATGQRLARFILIDDEVKIRQMLAKYGVNQDDFEIIHESDEMKAGLKAVQLVSEGKADIVMKGLMGSATFLKACLNKDIGICEKNSTLSAIAVVESPKVDRLLFITDLGITPNPDYETKRKILENAVGVARKFGIEEPKVACLSGSEIVNPRIASSADGAALEAANKNGEIKNCVVAGPISFDLAMSEEAARHKKYQNPVGGHADILLVPSVDTGNVLYKSITFFSEITTGGVMCGAKAPIVFCSRSDSAETKLNTIAMAVYLADKSEV